jgi:hypothetical protein
MFFTWIAKKWASNDLLPKNASVIALISYAATPKALTNGSCETVILASDLKQMYPEATVIWGSFPKDQKGEKTEKEIKFSIFPDSLYAGSVTSSTDECEAIIRTAKENKISLNNLFVVSEGAHSRRCKRVWKYFLPNSKICFRSVPAWETGDSTNPMWFQRYWRVWLVVNILADTLAYQWRPILKFLIKKNFSQPV